MKKQDEPKLIDLRIITTHDLNPDQQGRPSPIQLDIYEVNDTVEFLRADYLTLGHHANIQDNSESSSGQSQDSIDKAKYSWIIQPDAFFYDEFELPNEVTYLGVLAHYQQIEDSDWRILFERQDEKGRRNNYLYLMIDDSMIRQLSKSEMNEAIVQYAKNHPSDERFTPNGRLKNHSADYSKGVFLAK